ncbi:MAG: pirin family protein [Xanthomonadales bacterium]|jgi:redox-sensitive bicupin YhaK (pirin superfamily)|nr:pirin family protein [Xanthomonadales bacterium]
MSALIEITPLGFPWPTLDPFLFCVHHLDHYPAGGEHQGPDPSLLAGRQLGMDFETRDGFRMYHGRAVPGFPRHPHRGFETVTLLTQGYCDHSDSLGATARFGPGDAQWMTAGRGIEHAEMFPLRHRDQDNTLELFQLWLNLPASRKLANPSFSMLWRNRIPRRRFTDAQGRDAEIIFVAGGFDGVEPAAPPPDSWASQADADVAIWLIHLAEHATYRLPSAQPGSNRALYFYRGDHLTVEDQPLPAYHRATLRADQPVDLQAGPGGADLLLLQGRPINEPVAQQGPFVMNTPGEIRQAFLDYQRDRFGQRWPWDADDPVHDRERDRFAIHADGREDTPGDGVQSPEAGPVAAG